MAKLIDPDNLAYADYTYGQNIDPDNAAGTNLAAHLLIDFTERKFALTAPLYGQTDRPGVGTLVGFANTGGVSGQALYSKFKNIWKEDPEAIRFPFPMEAITPESFEFINNWTPDEETLDTRTSTAFITRKLLRDCGWAEKNLAGNIKRKYFGIITLGGLSVSGLNVSDQFSAGIATVYCSQFDPGISTSIDLATSPADTVRNRIFFPGNAVDMYSGNRIIVQHDESDVGLGGNVKHNDAFFISYADGDASAQPEPVGAGYSFSLHTTRDDALAGINSVSLTDGTTGIVTFRNQSDGPNFIIGITEEGGQANEPFIFYQTKDDDGSTVLYDYTDFFKIYYREEGKTYAEQSIDQIGVTVLNYQAYRIPLQSIPDVNIDSSLYSDTKIVESSDIQGIGVSFFQEPQTVTVGGAATTYNVYVNANQQPLKAVYAKMQYLLRNSDAGDTSPKVNALPLSGINTSINSLSAVGFGTDTGAKNEFGNDFRYGKIEEPVIEFVGVELLAKKRADIFGETDGGTNHGVYIANVNPDDLNSVAYFDNSGNKVIEPFVASANISFNAFLSGDGDAKFWVFYDEADDGLEIPIPGLFRSVSQNTAGTVGSTDGIDATNNIVVTGNTGDNHPFVQGQKVVAIGTAEDIGIGIACTTVFDPTLLGSTGQGISTAVYYLNVQKEVGVAQTFRDITETGTNTPSSSDNVTGAGVTQRFALHNSYADAVYNVVGINTINLTVSGSSGLVTFRQLDINYSESNATVVQTSVSQAAQDGISGGKIYLDGLTVPSDQSFQITYDYDSNSQRNRIPGNADNTGGSFDPKLRVVAVGLQTGQFANVQATLTRAKGQSISIVGPLERVYSDPA
jgi:hypothetical protein